MISDNGWIKLHRSLLEWEWFSDLPCFRLFTFLLLTANHKPSKFAGHEIPIGSRVCGIYALSESTGLTPQQVRTAIKKLKSTQEITIKTTTKFSIISITNWKRFQGDNKPITNEQQTNNKPTTTSKEGKKVRKKKEECDTREDDFFGNQETAPQTDLAWEALEIYNNLATEAGLSIAQKLTESRRSKLLKRIHEAGGLDGWKYAIEKVRASAFLTGQKTDFRATFDFLLQQESFTKLMEGSYDDRKPRTGTNSKTGKPLTAAESMLAGFIIAGAEQ